MRELIAPAGAAVALTGLGLGGVARADANNYKGLNDHSPLSYNADLAVGGL
jgi:hypothetical protein